MDTVHENNKHRISKHCFYWLDITSVCMDYLSWDWLVVDRSVNTKARALTLWKVEEQKLQKLMSDGSHLHIPTISWIFSRILG